MGDQADDIMTSLEDDRKTYKDSKRQNRKSFCPRRGHVSWHSTEGSRLRWQMGGNPSGEWYTDCVQAWYWSRSQCHTRVYVQGVTLQPSASASAVPLSGAGQQTLSVIRLAGEKRLLTITQHSSLVSCSLEGEYHIQLKQDATPFALRDSLCSRWSMSMTSHLFIWLSVTYSLELTERLMAHSVVC